jgi:hypothetical protein
MTDAVDIKHPKWMARAKLWQLMRDTATGDGKGPPTRIRPIAAGAGGMIRPSIFTQCRRSPSQKARQLLGYVPSGANGRNGVDC